MLNQLYIWLVRERILPLIVTFVGKVQSRSRCLRQLSAARKEISMNVSFCHGNDPHRLIGCRLDVLLSVPIWINDNRFARNVASNQIASMSKLFVIKSL